MLILIMFSRVVSFSLSDGAAPCKFSRFSMSFNLLVCLIYPQMLYSIPALIKLLLKCGDKQSKTVDEEKIKWLLASFAGFDKDFEVEKFKYISKT